MIELVVKGVPYTDFTSATCTVAVDTLSNEFSFTATAIDAFPPFKQGDLVVVIVDGVIKVTGSIEEVSGIDQEGAHVVTYSGRDKTGDLIDSTINVINDIRADGNLTLKKIIEIVIDHLGADIKVIDNFNPEPFNAAEDIVTPEVGQGAMGLISIYARKRQALLSSDGDGNIVITQSSPIDSGATLQRITGADSNNIISQSWTITGSERFNKYIHRGQLDPRALSLGSSSDIAAVENQGAEVTNSDVRVGRQRVIVETNGYSSAQLKDRAKWASQLAKARAIRFTCSVRNHVDNNGAQWIENTLAQVTSDVADIFRKMLINSVTFSQGEGQPMITSLELVEKNVYTINDKLLTQKTAGNQNDAFTFS